jgi:ABC-type amino acid transport system permease subunit
MIRYYIAEFSAKFHTAFIADDRWKYIVEGLGNTLRLTFFALLVGIVLGVVVAIIRSTWDKTSADLRPGPAGFLCTLPTAYARFI